ncbi:hypothetical protein [Mesorhizobium sp. CN2-181]|uniref:hypothetical protein n=1 Tax=Mesorhizobium yinganensis TaxID=3157707 RepID=UPI0032B7C89B
MDTFAEAISKIGDLSDAMLHERLVVSDKGQINGRTVRDCPPGHIMLRQPPSSEKDIRVTIPAQFMSEWKPDIWKDSGLKLKKVMVMQNTDFSGIFALLPVAHNIIGKGVYRLEQNAEDGQARFMTTRNHLGRCLNEAIEFVAFKLHGSAGMVDLRGLKMVGE